MNLYQAEYTMEPESGNHIMTHILIPANTKEEAAYLWVMLAGPKVQLVNLYQLAVKVEDGI